MTTSCLERALSDPIRYSIVVTIFSAETLYLEKYHDDKTNKESTSQRKQAQKKNDFVNKS